MATRCGDEKWHSKLSSRVLFFLHSLLSTGLKANAPSMLALLQLHTEAIVAQGEKDAKDGVVIHESHSTKLTRALRLSASTATSLVLPRSTSRECLRVRLRVLVAAGGDSLRHRTTNMQISIGDHQVPGQEKLTWHESDCSLARRRGDRLAAEGNRAAQVRRGRWSAGEIRARLRLVLLRVGTGTGRRGKEGERTRDGQESPRGHHRCRGEGLVSLSVHRFVSDAQLSGRSHLGVLTAVLADRQRLCGHKIV